MRKAIAFDMYGVILRQTGEEFLDFVKQTFPHATREMADAVWFEANVGRIPSDEVWKALGYREEDIPRVEKEYLDTLELQEGILEFLKNAGERYRLAILSNDFSGWSRYVREKFQLDPFFSVISISGDLKMAKPGKDIFEVTLQKLGVRPEECLFIDDRPRNLLTAKKLGMETVLFGKPSESYTGVSVQSFGELWEYMQKEC